MPAFLFIAFLLGTLPEAAFADGVKAVQSPDIPKYYNECRIWAEPSEVKVGEPFTVFWDAKPVGTVNPPPVLATPPPKAVTVGYDDSNSISLELHRPLSEPVVAPESVPPAPVVKPEPAKGIAALFWGASWGSKDTQLKAHFPGDKVAEGGKREFKLERPGTYYFGLGLKGASGGFESSCKYEVRVGPLPLYPGVSIEVTEPHAQEYGVSAHFVARVDPKAQIPPQEDCSWLKGVALMVQGVSRDKKFKTGPDGICVYEEDESFSNGLGATDVNLFRRSTMGTGLEVLGEKTILVIPPWIK